jgi:hypothetical protein
MGIPQITDPASFVEKMAALSEFGLRQKDSETMFSISLPHDAGTSIAAI